jgi:DNA-binding MarR family transcriptional regulator
MNRDIRASDIRTSKDGNWAWFNKQIFEDPRLRPIDKLVYLGLTYFANNETQSCFPSIPKLQEITGFRRRSIIKAIHRLEELGYIRIERHQGRSSTYYLLDIHQCTKYTSAPNTPVHDMHQCTTCTGVVHHMHGGGAPHARGWCTRCTHNKNYITRINNNNYLTKNERSIFENLNFKDKNSLEEPSLKENINAPTKNNAPTNNNAHIINNAPLINDFPAKNDHLEEGGATLCKIEDNLEPVSNILNNLLSPKEKSILDKIEKYKVENIEERLKILSEQAEKLCKKENANGYGL